MACDDNVNVRMSDSDIRLIIPTQLLKITKHHQIMCGCNICIQGGTYQDFLNRCSKQRLRYINHHSNSFTGEPAENINSETIFSRYSDVLLTDGYSIHSHVKDAAFASIFDFPEKYIKFPKWSCV